MEKFLGFSELVKRSQIMFVDDEEVTEVTLLRSGIMGGIIRTD